MRLMYLRKQYRKAAWTDNATKFAWFISKLVA
jgi:hypothetical protein